MYAITLEILPIGKVGLVNLDDSTITFRYINMIAESGGVVGIAFFAPAICGDNHVTRYRTTNINISGDYHINNLYTNLTP